MAGLVPAIHVFDGGCFFTTWMPGTLARKARCVLLAGRDEDRW